MIEAENFDYYATAQIYSHYRYNKEPDGGEGI